MKLDEILQIKPLLQAQYDQAVATVENLNLAISGEREKRQKICDRGKVGFADTEETVSAAALAQWSNSVGKLTMKIDIEIGRLTSELRIAEKKAASCLLRLEAIKSIEVDARAERRRELQAKEDDKIEELNRLKPLFPNGF